MDHSKNLSCKSYLIAGLLRLLKKTWRVEIEGKDYLDHYYANGGRCLLAFWHGKYAPIFPLLEGYKACVITSLSVRGNILGELCRRLGYKNAQIPDEPRLDSFKTLLHDLEGIQVCGTAFDGPLGPYHQTKPGLIRLSGMLGLDVVPVSVYNSRHFTGSKRWDKLEIPLPFSHVCLIFGESIPIPSHPKRTEIETLTERINKELDELEIKAEAILRRKGHA